MNKIRTYLEAQNIAQADFAKLVGASKSFINEIVNGHKRPGLDLAFAIERATNGEVPASTWLDDTPETDGAAK